MKIEEGIELKKDSFGWHIVYPTRNKDGSINWFNFITGGTWWNLIKVGGILAIIGFITWSYFRDINACVQVMQDPCKYCDYLGGMLG